MPVPFDITHLISLLLCIIVAISYIPQLIKSFRTRETRDISYGFLVFQASEDLLVCLYAAINHDTILLSGGAISLSLITILSVYKYSRDGFDTHWKFSDGKSPIDTF